jgi:hypothetical protein
VNILQPQLHNSRFSSIEVYTDEYVWRVIPAILDSLSLHIDVYTTTVVPSSKDMAKPTSSLPSQLFLSWNGGTKNDLLPKNLFSDLPSY